jgi:hypothetical protein
MAVGIVVLLWLIYITGGGLLLGGVFVILLVGADAIGMRGNRRRRPTRIILSRTEIRAEFRDGRTRSIPRDQIDNARLRRFLGDTLVDLHYGSGRWESDVHIYGDAAVRVKGWFDASRSAKG